jgi:nicotinamide mononucleotide transporter
MLDWLVNPLNTVLFHLANDAVTWAELLGFITGGVCVWLTVRRHVLNFPIGIANSALFLILFTSARLWADAALQIMFIALGAAGWLQWVRSRGARDEIRVLRARPVELAGCAAFVVAGTVVLTYVLRAADDTAPFWDALTTALSIAAQWLLNARRLETWFFWIAADCIYVPLYVVKRLDLTAAVYVLFLGLCVAGFRSWQAARSSDERENVDKTVTVPA